MKFSIPTIIIFVILSLATANLVPAQTESEIKTFTISGMVGMGGVLMLGLPGNVVTDSEGHYSAVVETGWTGTVTPRRRGYTFKPASMTYNNVTSDQDEQNYLSKIITITISGNVGLGGVVMIGLPGNPQTGPDGDYSAVVDYGWTGNVKPTKEGFIFEPPSLVYSNVVSDLANQNYKPEIITFTISGNAGIDGVELYGLPGNPVADAHGNYSCTVPYGWAGTVTPKKEGYDFEPPSRSYSKLSSVLTNENYNIEPIRLTISGEVIQDDKSISGVVLKGFPGDPITGRDGKYNVHVDYGWSGVVVPEKEGYTFLPPQKEYSRLSRDQINNRYIAKPKMFTISGRILVAGTPLEGVLLSANNGGGSSITDAQGRYSVEVPYGWTGEISMSKQGLVFEPPSTSYRNVTENFDQGQPVPQQSNPYRENVRSPQRGLPKPNQMTIGKVSDRKVIVIPSMDVKAGDFNAAMEDMRVMLQILDEKLINEPSTIRGVLMDYGDFFGGENQLSKAVYIQGYGVLFLMEVNFPLLFTPELQNGPEEAADENTDPVWRQAREKVFSPKDNIPGSQSGSRAETIQERVERLKSDLIKTMKHASNIRQLKPDEWIIFNVTGFNQFSSQVGMSGISMGGMSMSGRGGVYGEGGYSGGGFAMGGSGRGYGGGMSGGMARGSMAGSGMGGGMGVGMGAFGEMSFSSSTVLTIRAKKSDVDAFAKDELDIEQFQQKINVFVY